MSNIIQFPTPDVVRVTPGTDVATGHTVYTFELVEGPLRNVIGTCATVEEATSEAASLMAQGYDVLWDEQTLQRLFPSDGGTAA